MLVSEDYVLYLIQEANEKMTENLSRIHRFTDKFVTATKPQETLAAISLTMTLTLTLTLI